MKTHIKKTMGKNKEAGLQANSTVLCWSKHLQQGFGVDFAIIVKWLDRNNKVTYSGLCITLVRPRRYTKPNPLTLNPETLNPETLNPESLN